MTGYREWRKQIVLLARRQAIQGKANETGLAALSVLEGASWRQCEDLDLDALEKEDVLKSILSCLDAPWPNGSTTVMSRCLMPSRGAFTRPSERLANLF